MEIDVKLETINYTIEIGGAVIVDSLNWGNIGGTLSNQTDLQTALNNKVDLPSLTDNYLVRADGTGDLQNSNILNADDGSITLAPTNSADFGLKILNAIKSGAYGAYLQNNANGLRIASTSGTNSNNAILIEKSSNTVFKLDALGKVYFLPTAETQNYLPRLDSPSKGLDKLLIGDANGDINWKDFDGFTEKTSFENTDYVVIFDKTANQNKKVLKTNLGIVSAETDPVFTAWDKSTGISITESQISDFGTYSTDIHANITELNAIDGNVSTFTNDAGYITSGDIPANNWKEFTLDVEVTRAQLLDLHNTNLTILNLASNYTIVPQRVVYTAPAVFDYSGVFILQSEDNVFSAGFQLANLDANQYIDLNTGATTISSSSANQNTLILKTLTPSSQITDINGSSGSLFITIVYKVYDTTTREFIYNNGSPDPLTVSDITDIATNYLGINAKAADSDKLDGFDSLSFSLATHNHSGVYEPANSNIQNHISSTSNPHSVTRAQIGAQETLVSGTNIKTINTNSLLGSGDLTITGYSDEQAQDAVGTILTDSDTIDFTYNDGTPSITATVKNTLAGQSVWTDTFTVSRTSDVVITTTSTALIANTIIGRICRWTDSGGTNVRRGFITSATESSGTVTINLNGDAFASGDTNFRIGLKGFDVLQSQWYVTGEQVADSTNPVGRQDVIPYDISVLSCSSYVGTAASGTSADLKWDLYDDGVGIFTTDPSFSTNTSVLNSIPDRSSNKTLISAGSRITLRTPTSGGATNKASDLNVIMFYGLDDWWDAV